MSDLSNEAKSEVISELMQWQDFVQGQITALRIALYSAFRAAQSNAELRALVESTLEAHLQLMKEHPESQASIAGYESALRDLVLGFHAGNTADSTH